VKFDCRVANLRRGHRSRHKDLQPGAMQWHTVKALGCSPCVSNCAGRRHRARLIGLDEVSLKRGQTYRIVVKADSAPPDLVRRL
jgi:hypothetical protein